MVREERKSRQKQTERERFAFHWQPPIFRQTKAIPMHRQTESVSLAPGHWAENAPLNGMWVRLCMRIMLRTGLRLQCFFTGGGGTASEEAAGAGFPVRRVILSPEKAGRGVV